MAPPIGNMYPYCKELNQMKSKRYTCKFKKICPVLKVYLGLRRLPSKSEKLGKQKIK